MNRSLSSFPSGLARLLLLATAWLILAGAAHAQRQMENLGRGVIALRSSSSAVYVGWRLLATDPESIAFNVYRSQAGGAPVKLNSMPIVATTDFVDTGALLSVANEWFVRPVVNGVELAPSARYGVPANAHVPVDFQARVGPYVSIPLRPTSGSYYVHHCWPGDLDGDGEYDFVLTRLPNGSGNALVEAYLRDGTFLWRMDMGPNSTSGDYPAAAVSHGHSDNVTVYDLDGDGKAEVLVRTANGVTVTNATGVQVASITAADNLTQFVSVINGMTGQEKARQVLPNPVPSGGPMGSHFGIMYGDGVRPSLVISSINRNSNGSFNHNITIWNFREGVLTRRWTWTPPNDGRWYSRGHQIRIADVTGDGKDEFIEIGFALRDMGTHAEVLYSNGLAHGDRYHVTDLDPDRPGLETYSAQQNNPTMLATALTDAATGEAIHLWYASSVVDVGRANASELVPGVRGVEVFSTEPGLWSARGEYVSDNKPWPNFGIWWSPDLSREQLDNARIDKYGVGRIISPYYMQAPAKSGRATWRNAQPLYGDLFGDWREEVVFEATDESALLIFTPVTQNTTRMVSLAQDPQYRSSMTYKGYMQTNWPSFYLGSGMGKPPVQPISDADLVWKGGVAGNAWDAATANWYPHNVWTGTRTATVYSAGQKALFDRTGSNGAPVNVVGTLTPAAVKIHSATDYTFVGGTLAGSMELVKAGRGRVTLNNSNTFTGRTLISEGSLIVNGAFPSSPVVVRGGAWLDGRLGGAATVGAGATFEQGGGVSPGQGVGAAGVITVANGAAFTGWTRSDFDLSNDPTGASKANDRLHVEGNLQFGGLSNTFVIHKLDGALSPGVYSLITYTGSLLGNINSLVIEGLSGVPFELSNPPGTIALIVKEARNPTSVVWVGGLGGTWDLVTAKNWLNAGERDWFAPNDTARFDNSGLAHPVVGLVGSLPTAGVTFDSTGDYTFSGSGRISGAGSLIKRNSGRLRILTQNEYTGPTVVEAGTLEVDSLNVAGVAGPLGSASADPNNLIFHGATFRIASAQTYTDRGIRLASGSTTVEVPLSGANVNLSGQITGPGALVKSGIGMLLVGSANNFTGGSTIATGTLQLASPVANTSGLGTGTVTLTGGGILSLYGSAAGDLGSGNAGGPLANTLHVPAGASGSFYTPFRFAVNSALTGGGTLNVRVTGSRCNYSGNWSAFTGQINVNSRTGTSDFRVGHTGGWPNARLHLNGNVFMYSRATANATIPIGQLSGAADATISAGWGSGEGAQNAVTWRVGGLNTDATFAGIIQGTTRIIKEGSGSWTLTGANTYTGTTEVRAGRVMVDGSLGNTAVTVLAGGGIGGSGSIGGAVALRPNSVLRLSSNGFLSFDGTLTIDGAVLVEPASGAVPETGTYTLFTYSGALAGQPSFQWSGPAANVTFDTSQPGIVRYTITATIRPPSAVTWVGNASSAWDGATANWSYSGGATRFIAGDSVTFDESSVTKVVDLVEPVAPSVVLISASSDYVIDGGGSIMGEGELVKEGSGRLTLRTANSYSGGTRIRGGMLGLGYDSGSATTGQQGGSTAASGAPTTSLGAGPIVVESGAELRFGGRGGNTVWTFVSEQPIAIDGGVLRVQDGQQRLTSLSIGPAGATLLTAWQNKNLWISGPFFGSGPVVIDDVVASQSDTASAMVRVSSAGNSYSGVITINGPSAGFHGGRLQIEANSALEHATIMTNHATASGVVFSTSHPVVGALGGSGNLALPSGMLIVGGNGSNSTYSGSFSGAGGLEKVGTGKWILIANHSFGGPIVVRSGTLVITGSVAAGPLIEVLSGATLELTGSIAAGEVIVRSGGSLIGGGRVDGPLLNEGLIFGDGATALWDFRGPVTNAASGTILLTRGAQILAAGAFENWGTLDLITAGSPVPGQLTGAGVVLDAANLVAPSIHSWGSAMEITVASRIGHGYQLQRSTTLQPGSWENVGEPQMGTGSALQFSDHAPPPGEKAFYRIAIWP
jgi:fibronectin-binding autotransporter adhesin